MNTIQWTRPSSSPQWLSGDIPATILILSSNIFKISRKKNETFSRFINVPLFCAFGLVESAESWKCFLLLAECWFTIPRVETNESKNLSCMFEVQCNKDYLMSINYCITWCTFMLEVRSCPGSFFFADFVDEKVVSTLRKINQAFLPVYKIVSGQNYALGKVWKP